MKKKLLLLLIAVITLTLVTGCSLFKKETKVEKIEPASITEENLEDFYKISSLVFRVEKDTYKVKDFTEEDKAEIARSLPENGFLDTTGTEMTTLFQKHFGSNQTVKFEDIDCDMEHESPEEQVLYTFDKEQDKYVYNDKHPGHGGAYGSTIDSMIEFNGLVIEGNTYRYIVKVLFYGPVSCQDIGPCSYGKAYKSYNDAKNDVNTLDDIDNKYTVVDPNDQFPRVDLDQVMRDHKSELNEYVFTFVKENNNYIFKGYKKK